MLTLTDRGLILRVSDAVNTEIAGHGGLVAAVSGCFVLDLLVYVTYGIIDAFRNLSIFFSKICLLIDKGVQFF